MANSVKSYIILIVIVYFSLFQRNNFNTNERNLNSGSVILFGEFTHKENITEHRSTIEAVENDDKNAKQGEKNSLTYDKKYVSHALVFHGYDLKWHQNRYGAALLMKLRHNMKGYNQRWIHFSHETPFTDALSLQYDNVFNWSMSYNRKANVFAGYGQHSLIGNNKLMSPPPPKNYSANKDKLVVWRVSNCGPKLRLQYALQLEKYIPLMVIGGCGKYFKNHRNCPKTEECKRIVGKYKFYLAFENRFCEDYVTEKYWETLDREQVPIHFGDGDNVVMVPGSYIDASKFSSIKALADHLLFLDQNPAEYNKYFEWKNKYYLRKVLGVNCVES